MGIGRKGCPPPTPTVVGGGLRRNYIIPSHPSSHANNDDKRHKDNAVYLDVTLDKDGGGWEDERDGELAGEREEEEGKGVGVGFVERFYLHWTI